MTIKLETNELKEMVSRAIKCVSNNKLIPLTSLMNIKVVCNHLILTTTDATNFYYVKKPDKVDCEDFEVSVSADLFTKLVQKTTSDYITLVIENGVMKVKGNGTYTMELPLDENGRVIKFPNKTENHNWESLGLLKTSFVKAVLSINKVSLADSMEVPVLTNYYCGETVISTNKKQICSTAIQMFSEPLLITSNLMDLLGILLGDSVSVSMCDSEALLFESPTDTIYAPIEPGIETFPVDPIMGLIEADFESMCKVPRNIVLDVIERLALFVSPYDKKGIYLTFTNEGIMFSSKKSSGTELVAYKESSNFSPYTCCLDIEMLKSHISAQGSEDLELYYGSDISIKMVDRNVTQIIALLEDDRQE